MKKNNSKSHIKPLNQVTLKSSEINSPNLRKPLKSIAPEINPSPINILSTPWKNSTLMTLSCPNLKEINFSTAFQINKDTSMPNNSLEPLLLITMKKKMKESKRLDFKTIWNLLKSKQLRKQRENKPTTTWKKYQ